jgi:hypothetical protein
MTSSPWMGAIMGLMLAGIVVAGSSPAKRRPRRNGSSVPSNEKDNQENPKQDEENDQQTEGDKQDDQVEKP